MNAAQLLRVIPPEAETEIGLIAAAPSPEAIGALAATCLHLEVETFPKPGLVSHVDNGSHADMDASMLHRSAGALRPFFAALAQAGAHGAGMERLRAIGVAAEAAMLGATGGVNTHRGAIFGLGLLCAAAALPGREGETLGGKVRRRFGRAIANGPVPLHSHGSAARRIYGASGARGEAAAGFPSVYDLGAPALEEGSKLAPDDPEAARVQATFALIQGVADTNLLHRGGADGLAFAQSRAKGFLDRGGVGAPGWRAAAACIHGEFVALNLSPGGSADLLAMSLFVHAVEGPAPKAAKSERSFAMA
jgi:triphosphoribosyl-dephospho-CoA synthase